MGIDVYAVWPGITEEERQRQRTGFSTTHGHVGYLREAYHGGPYATKVLVPEGFDPEPYGCAVAHPVHGAEVPCARIPARSLYERVPAAVEAIKERYRRVYGETLTDDSPEVRALHDFAELYARLEEGGRQPSVYVSW